MSTKTLERICLATNFGPESEPAHATASSLARAYGSRIDLVTVVEPPSLYARVLSSVQSSLADLDAVVAKVHERLDALAAAPPLAGLDVTARVCTGVAFREIIRQAREVDAQLIVVGNKPVGDAASLLLGHTAERVLRKSSVPVLVAKSALPTQPKVVVAPTDFSPASLPAVRQAVSLGRQWGAKVHLLHIIEPAAEVYGWGADLAGGDIYLVEPEALDPEWKALFDEVDLANVQWEQATRRGYAVETLCDFASERHADLIVMGTHGRSALPHALLGSVAEGVSRHAAMGVLTVRADGFTFELP